jgi:uncharacterized repeat protein (TIGR01451 family)
MKKKIGAVLLVVALALGLTVSLAPTAAQAVIDPVVIYGTRLGTYGGDIYEIDVANQTATLEKDIDYNSATSPPNNTSWPNGNAFDGMNNRLYFSTIEDGYSDLYFYDFDGATPHGPWTLDALSAGAGFYQGKYYYIDNNTANLRAVSFNADGSKAGEVSVCADFNGADPEYFGFGDLVITPDGMLYASATVKTATTSEPGFFKLDLADPCNTYELYTDPADEVLQLAVGSDGQVYGHNAGTGNFYVVDVSDGTLSTAGFTIDTLKFTDLASGPYPSIEITKEADREYAYEGDTINYLYRVHNNGIISLGPVVVTDSLPIAVSPVLPDTIHTLA